ncbi:uncharacterized protein N7459_001309 [Penicillium hispanicum]|uniref:uncharacterized protein n=1 Tax=Penicillium hispanicum TaxID=1080232 RepID=UPI0025422FAF|nr:uncharacterized protein N7459_001309 [Penicillium hispanicum]KAJ5595101.1 hypothetical protein N7459_001309 [Penicillium hispanicum]
MRSKTSVKPSAYPPLPFHTIRALGFLSSVVIAIILAVFIYHLHADGYKLPFAFLILLITAVLSLVNVIFTSLINCSRGLSPKFSIFLNILLLILWAVSLGLLAYSMSGTILTSCGTKYWANSTGISICRSYKALFTFTVLGCAAHIAALALDVIVRRRQTRLGAYGPMESTAAFGLGDDPMDVKMSDRRSQSVSGVAYDAVPAPMAGAHHAPSYSNGFEQAHEGEAAQYYDAAPARSRRSAPRVRFSSYEQSGYQHPAEQTGYDPAMYR